MRTDARWCTLMHASSWGGCEAGLWWNHVRMRTDAHWNRFETISDHKMLVDGYFVGTLLKASRLQRAIEPKLTNLILESFRDLALMFSMLGSRGTLHQFLLWLKTYSLFARSRFQAAPELHIRCAHGRPWRTSCTRGINAKNNGSSLIAYHVKMVTVVLELSSSFIRLVSYSCFNVIMPHCY